MLLRGERFGFFLEDILIALLMFVPWPLGVLALRAEPHLLTWLAPLVRVLDWDRRIRMQPQAGTGLRLTIDGRDWSGLAALRRIVGFSPGFYVLLFVCWIVAFGLLRPRNAYLLLTSIGFGLALLFVPFEGLRRGSRRWVAAGTS